MVRIQSSVGSTGAVMRFPCGHSEPETSVAGRVRKVAGRAVWVGCRRCNVVALACAPAGHAWTTTGLTGEREPH